MRIGIGLPNTVPGVTGETIVGWAVRAEARGFDFVSTVGRIPWPSYDSLTTLAAVAGATERIGLVTNAVLGPTYPDLVLAKITCTLAQLAGGRLTLGLGLGARVADYTAAERSFDGRGAAFDRQLEVLHSAWLGEAIADGQPVGPPAPGGSVPVLIGGHSERALRRTVRWGAGWTGAGGGPGRAEPVIAEVRRAWSEGGRTGEPRLLGLAYFSVGDELAEESDRYIRAYYEFAGSHGLTIADQVVRRPETIIGIRDDFVRVGMNEVVFTPTVADVAQVDRLADILLT